MKNLYYLVLALFLIYGCSSYKTATKKLQEGDYSSAFYTSIKVFQKDKSEKKKTKQLPLLQQSYLKANKQDESFIELEQNKNSPDYKGIYLTLLSLDARNQAIKPYLPIYHNNKELKFPVQDYSQPIELAKQQYLNDYYNKGVNLLNSRQKLNARTAYNYFQEIKRVEPNYRDISKKINEAYNIGLYVISIDMLNQTGVPLPSNFKSNLLSSLNPAVNNFWTYIITDKTNDRDYDANIILRQAFVGNDINTVNTFNYEREIIDGWEYAKDRKGNIIKDSLNNPIKVDKYIIARARVSEFIRHKEAMMSADIQLYNVAKNKLEVNDPVAVNFVFENSYAILEGDRRAITDDHILRIVNIPPVPFPTSLQMLEQCGVELRTRLVNVLKQYN